MYYENEIWKEIPGYNGDYLVSTYGRVYSKIANKIMAMSFNQDGYLRLSIGRKPYRRDEKVHRLVAITFIPNPEHLPEVNHKNNIRSDNRVENLEWVSHKMNMEHQSNRTDLWKKVRCIETNEIFTSTKKAADANGGTKDGVWHACNEGCMCNGFHYEWLDLEE